MLYSLKYSMKIKGKLMYLLGARTVRTTVSVQAQKTNWFIEQYKNPLSLTVYVSLHTAVL
jgi:hypothetical protein